MSAEQSPVVPSVGAVPVEVPEEAVEAATRALSLCTAADAGLDVFARLAVEAAYPLIAAWVRAEERQRAQALRGDLNHLLQPVIGMARLRLARPDIPELNLAHVVERLYCALDAADHAVGEPGRADFNPDSYQRQGMQNPRAAGSAVPVATPGATSLDAAGIMRRFDQEISRSRDVIGRMDMGRPPASVATPTEPTEPVDEVVCPNCEHTIRARMSDATGPCTSECGKPADETCLRWACRNVGADDQFAELRATLTGAAESHGERPAGPWTPADPVSGGTVQHSGRESGPDA